MARDLYAHFAPRRARRVALGFAAAVVASGLAIVVLAPPRFSLGDRLGFVVVCALIVWFLLRQAAVRAVPSPEGLQVRNLVLGRSLEWPQIVSVRFGDRPWVQLDLDDGDTLAVMAIQRSDGASAVAESRRLATLVERHSGQLADPPSPL